MENEKKARNEEAEPSAACIWAKPPLEVFLENGLAGVKNSDGEVVLPASWGQVEIRGDCVAARSNGVEDRYWRNGASGTTTMLEDDHFYRNGKVGLIKNGKVWFDADYDEIDDWSRSGFDVVYTRIGKTPCYFTSAHRPILTKWREFPDVDGEGAEEPYYIWEKQNSPVLVTMERGGGPDDPQSCRRKNGFVRLDRLRKSDVLPMFAAGSQLRVENTYRLAEFDCAFTYIYSAYAARRKGRNALAACFRDFAWMGCFESTWERLILVSVSPRRRKPLDVRVLVRGLKDVPEWEPTGDFAVGVDESLDEDEMKVFMVQYFADHWPSRGEFRRWEVLDNYIPSQIRAMELAWRKHVEDSDNFTSKEGQAAYLLEASVPPKPAERVPKGRAWRNIERTCRMLEEWGAPLEDFATRICDSGWEWDEERDIAAVADNTVKLLEWALAHGSNPNHADHRSCGRTCLDVLEEIIATEEKRSPERRHPECLELASRMKELVVAAGGKRRAEILADRTPVWLEMPKGTGEQG